MKFTYRGVNYNHDFNPTDLVESELSGKYRGQDFHFQYPRHIQVPQSHAHLKYRGIPYCMGEPRDHMSMAVAVAMTDAKPEAPPTVSGNTGAIAEDDVAKIHCANLYRILERRQKAARERGDMNLLRLLEKEAQQMVC
ncbi:MAG: DUF4278 domain-containing protein [Limnospira sp.]